MSRHPESDSDWLDGKSPYATSFTQDELDDFWGTHAGDNPDCDTCRWLLTLADHLPPAIPARHEDEYDALARQFHESIAEGQTVRETAKALRILCPPEPA